MAPLPPMLTERHAKFLGFRLRGQAISCRSCGLSFLNALGRSSSLCSGRSTLTRRRPCALKATASVRILRAGLPVILGDTIVVGNEDAEPGVAEVVEVAENGFFLVRVFPGSVKDQRDRLRSSGPLKSDATHRVGSRATPRRWLSFGRGRCSRGEFCPRPTFVRSCWLVPGAEVGLMLRLAAVTGARRAELAALRREDVADGVVGHDVKSVADRLGHANAAMTLRVYAHAFAKSDRAFADSMGAMLEGDA